MKNFFKQLINVKQWQKKTKIVTAIAAVAIAVIIVLSCIVPSKAQMMAKASPEMKKYIQEDKNLQIKKVTVTYNKLICINYLSFSTSGADGVEEKYVGFANSIHKADEGAWEVTGQMVNYTYRMLGVGENLMHGAKLTIVLTVLSIIIGVILGTLLALGKIAKNPILRNACSGYIFFFRGTPLLIQLFVVYFTIPGIFGFAWKDLFPGDVEGVYKGAFVAALIAFALNSGAYCAEIVRAAIQSIDKGQAEAAKALGMSYGQTMRKIIIPQSIRRMVPPICNEFIMVLKDASLVFAISLMDITTISKTIMTSEGSYLVFIPALVIYLIITAFFTYIFNKIELKFSVYE